MEGGGRLRLGGLGRQVDGNRGSRGSEAEPLSSQLWEACSQAQSCQGRWGLRDLMLGRGFNPRTAGDSSERRLLLRLSGPTGSDVTVVAPHQDSLCTQG